MRFTIVSNQAERLEGLKVLLRQIDRRAYFFETNNLESIKDFFSKEKPDLLLADCEMDNVTINIILNLLDEYPALPIAILTDQLPSITTLHLLKAGIRGFIPRNLHWRLIVRALDIVILGGHYVPPHFLNFVPSIPPIIKKNKKEIKPYSSKAYCNLQLSPRQHQIMRLIHMGNTNKVISRTLGISEGTVKVHLATAFRVLGATNRAAAVAIYNGWQFNRLKILSNQPIVKTETLNENILSIRQTPLPLSNLFSFPKPFIPHIQLINHKPNKQKLLKNKPQDKTSFSLVKEHRALPRKPHEKNPFFNFQVSEKLLMAAQELKPYYNDQIPNNATVLPLKNIALLENKKKKNEK